MLSITYGLPSTFTLLDLDGFLGQALFLRFRRRLREGLFLERLNFRERRYILKVRHAQRGEVEY